MIGEQPQGAILRLGKVVKVHPSDHSVDLVMMDNGAKLANVQVLSPTASTRSGRVDLPEPDIEDQSKPWSLKMSKKQDLLAAVAMMAGTPICIGFLYPQVNELAMPEKTKNLAIDRHASDLYSVTDDQANTATHHPYGAYISMGVVTISIEKGGDFDKKWNLQRNTDNVANITQYTPLKMKGKKKGHGQTVVTPISVTGEVISPHAASSVVIHQDNVVATSRAEGESTVTIHGDGNIDAVASINIRAHAENDITAIAESNMLLRAGGILTERGEAIFLN